MSPEVNWESLVKETLIDLGAEQGMVPGARLRPRLDENARGKGLDLKEAIAGRQFSEFLRSFSEIVIVRQPGSDMLVGLGYSPRPTDEVEGARRLVSESHFFRKDVYDALTRVREMPFYYNTQLDAFTEDQNTGVALPIVTIEFLKRMREEFIETLQDGEVQQELRAILSGTENIFGRFQAMLVRRDLVRRWHEYNFQVLNKRLQDWARLNEVPLQSSWYRQQRREARTLAASEILAVLARYMTDEEIRSVSLPFRAVEEMYRDLLDKRGRS